MNYFSCTIGVDNVLIEWKTYDFIIQRGPPLMCLIVNFVVHIAQLTEYLFVFS